MSPPNDHNYFTQQKNITVSTELHHYLKSGLDYIHWRSTGKASETKMAYAGNRPEREEKHTG
jgi:hypothetical protein